MAHEVSFYLNGEAVTIEDPAPDLLLIDYLRSPAVGLAGAKKGCGEGGCGACTVILSRWDETKRGVEHRSINSCLRPVCALEGLAVTTIEGTGAAERPHAALLSHAPSFSRAGAPPSHVAPGVLAARQDLAAERRARASARLATVAEEGAVCEGMNPVAHRLAENNGTQCGYCTTGFVMNMSAFLANHPNPTKRQIEDAFDGNICRCTGYRPILTGMKTFASDWSAEDERNRMKCVVDDDCQAQTVQPVVSIPFPAGAKARPGPVTADRAGRRWVTPSSIDELRALLGNLAGQAVRLVHGNTSFGVYPEEFEATQVFVDIRGLEELRGIEVDREVVTVGSATTYTELIECLQALIDERRLSPDTGRIGAAHFMARRTAGTIVRNAASIGGNTMLVLHHIHEGEPFPSDLLTALSAIETEIELVRVSTGEVLRKPVLEVVAAAVDDPDFARDIVLLRYFLPIGECSELVLPQKVALREVNSHTIVNVTSRFSTDDAGNVEAATLVFGGIATYPWRARRTEDAMLGQPLDLAGFGALAEMLAEEVKEKLTEDPSRSEGLVYEGYTEEYRIELAVSFLYKAVINALDVTDPSRVPEGLRSTGDITWGRWPVSDGTQSYKVQSFKQPVSEPHIKLMAMFQASGQVRYTHEMELPETAMHGAFVLAKKPLATFHYCRPNSEDPIGADALQGELRALFPAFEGLITHEDIPPGGMNLQGMAADQPLFAERRVSYYGQVIAMVLAASEADAHLIATYVQDNCIGYGSVDWSAPWDEPVLSLDRAIEIGSVYPDCPKSAAFVSHVWRIRRPGSRFDWARAERDPLDRAIVRRDAVVDGVPCRVVESAQTTGGQVHFYMETQACVAVPAEGGRLTVHPSTQSPMEMHQTTAMVLGAEYHRVTVKVQQVGGGYGGKTEQTRFVTGPVALAAAKSGRPVRLVMPRADDTSMIGKRHPYYGQYQIAIDAGEVDPADRGLIRGMQTKMWGDGGAFYDCSFIVSNNIQARTDNAYYVPNFESQIDVCRTNTAPNTAMRSFGDVQAQIIQENAIDDAAFSVGMSSVEVREKNLYHRGQATPFGQALPYCYMREVWDYLKEQCSYDELEKEVETFNASNRWRKRGIYMLPVKYGSGYNLVMLEQAAASVSVYSADGTVVLHQGGVDMGQGMMTKVTQVAAYILGIPMHLIRIDGPDTSVTPNPSSTGASTGTAYNGEAAKRVCERLRSRLMDFGQSLRDEHGDEWCTEQGVDYWNYPEGWAAQLPGTEAHPQIIWQNLVKNAYQQRVSLVESFTAPISGGTTPVPVLEYKPKDEQPSLPGVEVDPTAEPGGAVDSFVGFTYSAACSVVEVDVLTGEVKIIRSDLVYDMGWSLNPALDVGQVEGAFIQGVGYVLTEKLVLQPDGEDRGRLNTTNTWRYKPPATTTIPLQLNVHLFPRDRAAHVPENPNGLLSSKEVGEPPLVLANSVFFAVKDAIRASRTERGLDGLFRLDAPATVQQVRQACEVSRRELGEASRPPSARKQNA